MPAGASFVFESFEVDPARRRLSAAGEPVAVPDRHLDVLLMLVARAGQIVAKDDLIQAGWKDVAVGDNSLEQAISSLRRVVGAHLIETVPRRGYRFTGAVERRAPRESDAVLDELLAPHRAFIEGRAALETLEAGQVARARGVFERALKAAPDHASAHVGLANAAVMQFEMTRADSAPDVAALEHAVMHAREACRLDPRSGEAWATLGFVLDRTGARLDALAAAKRAATLEPDNWRHHFRLAYVAWGEERLRAADRVLALLPEFPLARWLAATVHVARQAFDEAEQALQAGAGTPERKERFTGVALYWLLGLIHLARGDDRSALDCFDRELASEQTGHLYARECCANTWYAIGALRLRQGLAADARTAFREAIARVAVHPMARAGLGLEPMADPRGIDGALPRAAGRALAGAHADAARIVQEALIAAPPGNAGWLVPVEPLLNVTAAPSAWKGVLSELRIRAA